MTFHPDRVAALYYPLGLTALPVALVFGGVAVAMLAAGSVPGALVALAAGAAAMALAWLHLEARFRKTEYVLADDRLVVKSGGLFSDSTSELVVRNVTHVSVELPFLERQLLGTGTVRVESAGSAACEILMTHVREPEVLHGQVLDLLRANGFSLRLDEVLQEHFVCRSGRFVDAASNVLFGCFVGLVIVGDQFDKGQSPDPATLAAMGCLGLVVLALVLVARHLDLSSRRYRLYRHGVELREGFFTRRTTVLPVESIADTQADQGVLGRFLSFWDLKVSVQGATKEIRVTYIAEGTRFMEGIDAAVEALRGRAAPAAPGAAAGPRPEDVPDEFRGARGLTGRHAPDLRRALAPVGAFVLLLALGCGAVALLAPLERDDRLVVLALGGGVAALVAVLGGLLVAVNASCTTYEVLEDSVLSTFAFVVKRRTEFSFAKVTSVAVLLDPFDRALGTCSVRFTSIGSSETMTLAHLRAEPELTDGLLAKAGMEGGPAEHTVTPRWSFGEFVRAPSGQALLVMALLAAAGALTALAVSGTLAVHPALGGATVAGAALLIGLGAGVSALGASRSRLEVCGSHLVAVDGVLWRERVHVPLRQVKGLDAHHHLLSSAGTLVVDIAGDLLAMPQAQQQGATPPQGVGAAAPLRSNNCSVGYVPDLLWTLDGLDRLLAAPAGARAVPSHFDRALQRQGLEVRARERPHLPQALVPIGAGALTLAVLVAVAGFAADLPGPGVLAGVALGTGLGLLLALQTRATEYTVEPRRVRTDWGLLYRARRSILFRHVDSIRTEEGVLDKAFGTGRVLISTTGSSRTEMTLTGLMTFRKFKEEIHRHY